jgi:hypothetical protein
MIGCWPTVVRVISMYMVITIIRVNRIVIINTSINIIGPLSSRFFTIIIRLVGCFLYCCCIYCYIDTRYMAICWSHSQMSMSFHLFLSSLNCLAALCYCLCTCAHAFALKYFAWINEVEKLRCMYPMSRQLHIAISA